MTTSGALAERQENATMSKTPKLYGQYRRKGEPNETQKDCMLLRTRCENCPNKLSLSQCQVFKTAEVVAFMALSEPARVQQLLSYDTM